MVELFHVCVSDGSDVVDSEAVVELKSRIAEMEKDLEVCIQSTIHKAT